MRVPAKRAGVAFYGKQAGVGRNAGFLVIEEDAEAALAAGNVLDPVKAEADGVAEAADFPPLVTAAEGMRGIFDDAQTMPPGKGVHFFNLPGIAGIVDGHDREDFRSQAAFGIGQIQRAGLRQHVAGHGFAACGKNGLKGGHEGQGRHQNARFAGVFPVGGTQGVNGQREGRRAGVGGDDVFFRNAQIGGDIFFKLMRFPADAEVAVFSNNAPDGFGFCLTYDGHGKTKGHALLPCSPSRKAAGFSAEMAAVKTL